MRVTSTYRYRVAGERGRKKSLYYECSLSSLHIRTRWKEMCVNKTNNFYIPLVSFRPRPKPAPQTVPSSETVAKYLCLRNCGRHERSAKLESSRRNFTHVCRIIHTYLKWFQIKNLEVDENKRSGKWKCAVCDSWLNHFELQILAENLNPRKVF